MTKENLKHQLHDIFNRIDSLRIDHGVDPDSALYAYLHTAYCAISGAITRTSNFNEQNKKTWNRSK